MAKTSTPPPPLSLREALARKVQPSRTYRLQVADPTYAQTALRDAQGQLRSAHLLQDEKRITQAEQALAAASDAVEACWQPLRLLSIGERFEELLAEHKPTHAQREAGADWNPDTFRPALIAACAVDAGMSAEEWAQLLAGEQWSTGDRRRLFELALEANVAT